ncbi:hypothetical protein EB796_019804 [Bugula neritina]|uniref:Uncharacterized protein n=1 Tax=Bugula neritina TaxID=10212 RepID=A0A7J7J8H3_BUGNE|nr:hypothetical protein EB796_019804 [Bugula neritina]
MNNIPVMNDYHYYTTACCSQITQQIENNMADSAVEVSLAGVETQLVNGDGPHTPVMGTTQLSGASSNMTSNLKVVEATDHSICHKQVTFEEETNQNVESPSNKPEVVLSSNQQANINKKEAALAFEKLIQGRLPGKDEPQQLVEPKQNKVIEKTTHIVTRSEPKADADNSPQDKHVAENEPVARTDVMREADTNDEHEYPEEGLTKAILSKFKNKKYETTPIYREEVNPSTGISVKDISSQLKKIPSLMSTSVSQAADIDDEISETKGGVYENDEEELPPVGLTRNLLSAFKELQRSGENTPLKQQSRVGSTSNVSEYLNMYKEASGSCSENLPILLKNVARESDTVCEKEELPVRGTAKNLLNMFTKVNEDTKNMKAQLHKPSGVAKTQWKPKNLQSKSPKQLSVATNSNSVTESAKATEVCKENDGQVNEEELPTSGCTQGLLDKFSEMNSKAVKGNADVANESLEKTWFKQMEQKDNSSTQHYPSAAARKPLRDDPKKVS